LSIARRSALPHPFETKAGDAAIPEAQDSPAPGEADRLIERIYDAGVIDGVWREIMPEIVRYCGGRSAVVLVNDAASGRLSFTDEVGLAVDYRRAYLSDLQRDDLRLTDLIRHPIGTVRTDTMIPRYSAYRRSRAYRQLYRKLGTEHALGAFLYEEAGRTIGLRVFRPSADGPFQDEAIARYQSLLPHLARSLRLRSLRRRGEHGGDGDQADARQALDLTPAPIFLIERVRSARPMNAAAESLRANAPPELFSALSELSARALAAWRDEGRDDLTAALGGPGPRGLARYFVSMKVIPPPPEAVDRTPRLLALFSSCRGEEATHAAGLGRLFGLTRAEQALTAALAAGARLSDSAERLGISYETARTHLRNIFAKTGVDRQTELVRLTLSLPTLAAEPPRRKDGAERKPRGAAGG
jgi:DNA-binding CsgD family transcriptional regulator